MKTIDEIRAIPKIKLMIADNDCGIARFKLKSTKHTQHVRIIFSWHDCFDVVQAMFRRGKSVTAAEVEEIKRLFFKEEEISQCEVVPHPTNDLVTVIIRPQEDFDA